MKDYKDKIKKLLALAASDNEHEAKAALLKAKELMAEHKITEAELEDLKEKEVRKVMTGVTYTNRTTIWVGQLAMVIAENYCCRCAASRAKSGSQVLEIIFIGLDGDVDIAVNVFKYAVESAKSCAEYYLNNVYKYKYNSKKVENHVKMSYATGFVSGVEAAFDEQKNGKEAGWGLVMTVPSEVESFMKQGFKKNSYRGYHHTDGEIRSKGFDEGKKFNPNNKIRKGA